MVTTFFRSDFSKTYLDVARLQRSYSASVFTWNTSPSLKTRISCGLIFSRSASKSFHTSDLMEGRFAKLETLADSFPSNVAVLMTLLLVILVSSSWRNLSTTMSLKPTKWYEFHHKLPTLKNYFIWSNNQLIIGEIIQPINPIKAPTVTIMPICLF